MIVQLARAILVTSGALGGFAVSQQIDWAAGTGYSETFIIVIFIILGASMGYVLGGIAGREFNVAYRTISARLAEMETPALLLGAVGLLVGLLVAFILSSALLRYIERPLWLGFVATALLFMMCAYAGVALFMLPARDGTLSLSIPDSARVDTLPPKLLDTSAIIDGRFADLASTGVLEGPLRVPRFVLVELQTLADSADDGRRARGRRGLDLLTALSAADTAVQVLEADFPEIPTVDAKLVRLALMSGGILVTVDHNLTRVARVEGATVVNVHEVSDALKPVVLPGDSLRVEVTKQGKERDQGVGYLGDGTMVVVADGAELVGTEVDVRVTTVLQTAGGRMIFAKSVIPE